MKNICEFREVRYKETVCSPRVSTSPGHNTMALPIFPYYPQVGPVQRPPQLVGIAQHDGEAEDTSAVSTFTTFSPAPRRQPSLLYDIAMDTSVPACCENHCGLPVPLLANGSYNGHGRTRVDFKVSGSPRCGIQVSKVLRRDLEGLIGRDDIIVLNPESNSVRLKVEVSNPSPVRHSWLICVKSGRATKYFAQRSA